LFSTALTHWYRLADDATASDMADTMFVGFQGLNHCLGCCPRWLPSLEAVAVLVADADEIAIFSHIINIIYY